MKSKLIGKNEDTISNIFLNRGINPNDIFRLNEDCLTPPEGIKNLNEVCDIVHNIMADDKKTGLVVVIQDPDADGYMSSALIMNYLQECFPGKEGKLQMVSHVGKAHGIPVETIEAILDADKEGPEEIDLIIAPDCSSNEYDVHKHITKDLGIPIVILDHHDAPKYSPYATMVNISLDDSPNKKLAGGGVCLKFAQLFDKKFGFHFFRNYYDLACIANIADMIELNTPETIFISQEGMRNIHNTFLKTLYEAKSYNLGGEITPTGISFYVAPLINAMTRVGTMEEKYEFSEAITHQEEIKVKSTKRGAKEGDQETIQEAIVRKMNNIKARQDRQRDKAFDDLEGQIKEGNLDQNQILILDTENKFPKTFTGLIANQFVGKYKKPTLVGSYFEKDGKEFFGGSARGDDKSDLSEMKQFEQDSGLFEFAEGHEAAHGFSFEADRKDEIVDYFNTNLADITFEPIFKLDFDLDWKDINFDNLKEITRYAPFWARGLEEPIFAIRNLPVNKADVVVAGEFGNHRVSFKSGQLQFVKFKGVSTEDAQKLAKNSQTKIDVIGTIKYSTYKGESYLQMFVSGMEIKSSQKYLF